MYRYLPKKEFKNLVKGLMEDFKVYGTINKEGFPVYSRLDRFEELVLAKTPTAMSAKEFLFPQKETLLKFNMKQGTHEEVIEADDQVIIGLHPCDIKAIALMDRIFAYGSADSNYLARRAKTVIIGTDCMPDKYCFCSSLGNSEVDGGFDIFLNEVKGGYLTRTATERGAMLLAKYADTRKATALQVKELEKLLKKKEESFIAKLDAPASDLPSIYAGADNSPVWEKIGAICYGCGSCNNVCPTCYCFDVRDEVRPNLTDGERVRVWDGCTLEDFSKVAGGHNFRKTRADRLRHRFNRKFRYLTGVFDALFCVGCGRCSRTCLVKINITEVTNELISESHRKL